MIAHSCCTRSTCMSRGTEPHSTVSVEKEGASSTTTKKPRPSIFPTRFPSFSSSSGPAIRWLPCIPTNAALVAPAGLKLPMRRLRQLMIVLVALQARSHHVRSGRQRCPRRLRPPSWACATLSPLSARTTSRWTCSATSSRRRRTSNLPPRRFGRCAAPAMPRNRRLLGPTLTSRLPLLPRLRPLCAPQAALRPRGGY